ncbi:MAG: ATP-binding protein [Bacteroidaceae bacterium]|nr:ATP-binding protein [Bacteroidaceae bacterium]
MKNRVLDNPFVVGKYVSAEYFCDRETELQQLSSHIRNGRNVFFTAPRRMGKTGVICHYFAQQEIKDEYYTLFIDLYGTNTLRELVYLFGKAVLDTLRSDKEKMFDRIVDFFRSVHLGVSFDPITGDTGMDFSIGSIEHEQTTLDEIFQYLEKADRPCIVAFDEFQQISEYEEKNVEAILRTRIQHCRNTSFIYCGSKRHSIAQMFLSPSKPFYASSTAMSLDPIDKDKYNEFAQRMFSNYGKTLSADVLPVIYDRYNGCTWYVHSVLNELFAMTETGHNCEAAMIPIAIDNVLSAQKDNYQMLLSFLSAKQKMVIMAIAREGQVIQVNSSAFIRRHHLASASSVQSAIKGLLEKDIITRTPEGAYYVYDYFLSEWLRNY